MLEAQPQVLPMKRTDSRYFSTFSGSVPMSPHVTRYNGRSANSATLSAVSVLPVPGPPCKRIIRPYKVSAAFVSELIEEDLTFSFALHEVSPDCVLLADVDADQCSDKLFLLLLEDKSMVEY